MKAEARCWRITINDSANVNHSNLILPIKPGYTHGFEASKKNMSAREWVHEKPATDAAIMNISGNILNLVTATCSSLSILCFPSALQNQRMSETNKKISTYLLSMSSSGPCFWTSNPPLQKDHEACEIHALIFIWKKHYDKRGISFCRLQCICFCCNFYYVISN